MQKELTVRLSTGTISKLGLLSERHVPKSIETIGFISLLFWGTGSGNRAGLGDLPKYHVKRRAQRKTDRNSDEL